MSKKRFRFTHRKRRRQSQAGPARQQQQQQQQQEATQSTILTHDIIENTPSDVLDAALILYHMRSGTSLESEEITRPAQTARTPEAGNLADEGEVADCNSSSSSRTVCESSDQKSSDQPQQRHSSTRNAIPYEILTPARHNENSAIESPPTINNSRTTASRTQGVSNRRIINKRRAPRSLSRRQS